MCDGGWSRCEGTDSGEAAMISRHWTGVTKPGHAEAYERHLRNDTFPRLAAIPGFIEASILRRSVEGGTEFQIVTLWSSLSAITAFAGQQVGVAGRARERSGDDDDVRRARAALRDRRQVRAEEVTPRWSGGSRS
jgi:heme-degrading monooxygenase HmoA